MDEKQPTMEEMAKLCIQLGNRVIAYQKLLNDALNSLKDIASDPMLKETLELKAQLARLAIELAAGLAAMPELEVPDALVL